MSNNQKILSLIVFFSLFLLSPLVISQTLSNINIEAESGQLSSATTITDSTASGGAYIQIDASTQPPPSTVTCDLNATTSNFTTQVTAAVNGQTICLATGNYGTWTGTNKSVTIRPQNNATPTLSLSLRSGDCCFTIDGGRESFDATSGLIINGDGGPSIGEGVSNITIKNTKFTSGFRIDGPTNSNILFDKNLHSDLRATSYTAAIHLSYGSSQHSGVTIQNSLFRDMSSDGIQTGLGVNIINNEFARIEPSVETEHTDAIQSVGGGNITIRGNYIHEGEQAIGMFDGTGGNIIEHNVIKDFTAHWITLGGDRPASIIQFNTIVGSGARAISCASKSGYQSSQTIIRNNIAGTVSLTGSSVNCTPTENRNNMFPSGASGLNFNGTPTFQGGISPTSFLGYLLTPNSAGVGAATDGRNVGINP